MINNKTAVLSNSVTSIENALFARCKNLTSIIIPDGVTSIGSSAFSNTGITSLIIPDSVTSIGLVAFEECKNLKTVVIGRGVANMNEGVFANCPKLTSVTFISKIPPKIEEGLIFSSIFSGSNDNLTVYVPKGAVKAFQAVRQFNRERIVSFDDITIEDALEILKYLAGIDSIYDDSATPPTIEDALEVLKYLAGMENIFG
jgi:hypothetical protein